MRRGQARGSFQAFRIGGVPVRVHYSLALVVPLLAWAFAGQFDRIGRARPLLLPPFAWGLVVASLLVASVLVHELAHVLVARRAGGRVRSITLLFIGGVSELAGDAPAPRVEAFMALAGPAASLALGATLWLVAQAAGGLAVDARAALALVAALNLLVGGFNLLPAFPLDGGRVLRAALAGRLGRARATRAAASVGKALAAAMAIVGFLAFDLILLAVAGFVWLAAEREAAGVTLETRLHGLSVADAMSEPALALPSHLGLADAARRMLAARADAACVVTIFGSVVAAVTAQELRRASPDARRHATLSDLVAGGEGAVGAAEPLGRAMARLAETGAAAVPVIDAAGRPVGILAQRDVERETALRELAEPPPLPAGQPDPLTRT